MYVFTPIKYKNWPGIFTIELKGLRYKGEVYSFPLILQFFVDTKCLINFTNYDIYTTERKRPIDPLKNNDNLIKYLYAIYII